MSANEIPKGGRRGEHSRRPDDRVPPSPTLTDDFAFVPGSWNGFLIACDRCRRGFDPDIALFTRVGDQNVCASCWKAAGRPFPAPASMGTVHLAEVATRERMDARGGADAYLVKSGRT